MRTLCFFILCVLSPLALNAQTNSPSAVRLAIVPETPDSRAIADFLTAELSNNGRVQLLERADVERVYHEQGLSAVNQNYLKLGQILGADGLLLLEFAPNTNQIAAIPMAQEDPRTLNVRLIAVKPGVVLTAEKYSLVSKDLPDWSSSFSKHLDAFFPKLGVLSKDAVPISVVNLRSAVASADAPEIERQLKTLTIQRLSREPQLFVLERQRMQSLSEEKELKADESAFWNGSYLLEGVIDQNGYSKDIVTINARLTPPKGAEPLTFEVSASRTNLAEAVNQMVLKVTELLKINSATKEWNSADEATQYFNEAQWALRWGIFAEAQTAAESAWALGKKDLACALLRTKTYVQELSTTIGNYQTGQSTISSGFDVKGNPLGPAPSDTEVQRLVRETIAQHKFVHIVKITSRPGAREVFYAFSDAAPEPQNIDRAIYALELYQEFSRTSPDGEPKILWRGKGWSDWHNSEWYQLGIEDLVAASKVLQEFNLAPEVQKPVADKLAELRARARSVAEFISAAPSVHDSYFVGSRVARRDELVQTMNEHDSIFRCETDWGSYWQEKPEDDLVLYRKLLSSPVFCYIHQDFWDPKPPASHLIAWNEDDEKRIPVLWNGFVAELGNSSNVLLRMEAKALARADATNDDQAHAAESDWWSLVRSNREELVANNVELFYLGWRFISNPETEAMDAESSQKQDEKEKQADESASFEKQKQYLANFTPFDFGAFIGTFSFQDYTKTQAVELQPLITAYKSNMLAKLPATASQRDKFKVRNDLNSIEFFLEKRVNAALNRPTQDSSPPFPRSSPTPAPPVSQSALAVKNTVSVTVSNPAPELETNILLVNKFVPIPLNNLPEGAHAVTITAHHWQEGKLVLDFQYGAAVYSFDQKTNWQSTTYPTFSAIGIFEPATGSWHVINSGEVDFANRNRFYHRTALCRGQVFTSNSGQIRRFDAAGNIWQPLNIPDIGNCELFAVNGHLYAATPNLIAEITDDGAATHILASNRRQPPVSALDTEDLGTPTLFAGPGQSLRAAVGNKIVAWDGKDWLTVCPAPQAPVPPAVSDDGVLFMADGWNAPVGIWRLPMGSREVECCLRAIGGIAPASDINTKPLWKLPRGFPLSRLPAASRGSDLFLMADHSKSENLVNEQQNLVVGKKILPQNGYHAELLCFACNYPEPQKIFLKFNGDDASLPVAGENRLAGYAIPNQPSAWLLFSSNCLLCGRETPDAFPNAGAADPYVKEPQTGIWMIPLDEINTKLALQQKAQQLQQAESNTLARRAAQSLLDKYDRNHNGVIDPEEREDALDDPDFIKTELDSIDANHNGWLDPAELAYFDANHNKILEPKEQTGIGITLHLLAEKLFQQYNPHDYDSISIQDYEAMVKSTLPVNVAMSFDFQPPRADENHNGRVDAAELEHLMQRHLEAQLRPNRGPIIYRPMGLGPQGSSAFGERLKTEVEAYWQNPNGSSNRPRMNSQVPFGANNQ